MTQPSVTWQVTGTAPFDDFSQGGAPTAGYRVFWSASNGASGYIFVPKASISQADIVRAAIQDDVNRVAVVHQLNG